MAGVYKEVWTGEVIRSFLEPVTFLQGVPDYSRLVQNDVIHLVDIGAEPNVLLNNSTYPIPIGSIADSDVAISLDKLDTENTAVTDDELYAISYKKIQEVLRLHRQALDKMAAKRAIHAFAPASHSAATPIVPTTGADNGSGQKCITIKDIIDLKKYFDKLKVPNQGRILVLHPDHVADLLLLDETFKQQYKDIRSGQVLSLFGFEIHEYGDMPMYDKDGTTGAFTKVAFGATGTDNLPASVAFYAPRMFRARGSVEMYYKDSRTNPEYRRSVVGFRLHFVALPKKQEAIGAIVSDKVA